MFYKRILHATDLQGEHFKLCQRVVDFANFHKATLYLIHVIAVPNSLLLAQSLGFTELVSPAKEDAVSVLGTIADALSIPPQHLFVEVGSVKQHVLDKAKELQCELIILGCHSAHTFPNLLGTTAYQITQHAACDILILR